MEVVFISYSNLLSAQIFSEGSACSLMEYPQPEVTYNQPDGHIAVGNKQTFIALTPNATVLLPFFAISRL